MSRTWEARDVATDIVKRLADAGFTAYFAGGCVRDELLGLHPEDYDVATDAVPDQVRSLFRNTNEVGVSFGVMLVHSRGHTVEVATFREEGGYSDRRRPDHVRYADAPSDAHRRDFTINALFLDPLAPPDPAESEPAGAPPHPVQGRVIDLVRGLHDLRARLVRAVGDPDERLNEDHLRALRAVRFAARLDFQIDEKTADAIRRHAGELRGVSRERIGHEMRRMLSDARRTEAVRMLDALNLAPHVLGEPPGQDAGEESGETRHVAALPDEAAFPLALAAWALDRAGEGFPRPEHGLGEWAEACGEVVRRLRRALALTNDEREALASVLRILGDLEADWTERGVAARKRLASAHHFSEAMRLLQSRSRSRAQSIERDVAALDATPSGLAPTPLLTGDDLVEAGFAPGPDLGRVLREVHDATLEDRIATREEALRLARSLLEGR